MKSFIFRIKLLFIYVLGGEINVATYEGRNFVGGSTVRIKDKSMFYSRGVRNFMRYKKDQIMYLWSLTTPIIYHDEDVEEYVGIYFMSSFTFKVKRLKKDVLTMCKIIMGRTIWFNPKYNTLNYPQYSSGGEFSLYKRKNLYLIRDWRRGEVSPGGRK